MMRKLLACLATLVVVLSLSGPSKAQTPTGTIQGAVQDASGALVPDVKIRVININTNEARELRTDSAGPLRAALSSSGHVLGYGGEDRLPVRPAG